MNDLNQQLLQAVNQRNLPHVHALIQAGADVNYRDPNDDGRCVLSAAIIGPFDFVDTLVQAGATPNVSPSQSGTPLLYAVWNLDYLLIEFLLKHAKADVNGISFMAPGESPVTALDAAYDEKFCQDSPGSALVLDGIIALLKAYGGKCYHELQASTPDRPDGP